MAYFMDVVSQDAACPSLDCIEVPLYSDFDADYDIVKGTEEDWREISLYWDNDTDESEPDAFATISRLVEPEQVTRYVESAIEALEGVAPTSAARWLTAWLRRARSVYTFTLHAGPRRDEAIEALRAVKWCVHRSTGGIAQADCEGWSNQDGCLVTWEFVGEHTGPWQCAVLDESGGWQAFELELSDPTQRAAFLDGRVPKPSTRVA